MTSLKLLSFFLANGSMTLDQMSVHLMAQGEATPQMETTSCFPVQRVETSLTMMISHDAARTI